MTRFRSPTNEGLLRRFPTVHQVIVTLLLLSSSAAINNNSNHDKAANEVEISIDEVARKVSEKWWAMGLHDPHSSPYSKSLMDQNSNYRLTCSTSSNLSPGQFKFCRNTEDHMTSVFKGAGMAIMECQSQFRDRRWNCSVVSKENVFGTVAEKATRESAFVHALMAAGVVHAVSRACRDGELTTCGCSKKSRPKKAIRPNWLWGGCGDNTDHGYKFAHEFVDVAEKEINFPRHSPGLSRMLMNLHNNEVGRRAVYKFVKIGCKCHGVSGSCNVRTCWNQLPSFRQTGDRLRDRYDAAIKVAFNRQGTRLVRSNRKFKRSTKDDLLYTEKSPDFCESDPVLGSFGTRGRQCNRHSSDTGGCNLMCCGRGYKSQRIRVSERCNCRFQWCCHVKCQTCEKTVETQICK